MNLHSMTPPRYYFVVIEIKIRQIFNMTIMKQNSVIKFYHKSLIEDNDNNMANVTQYDSEVHRETEITANLTDIVNHR